MKQVKTRSAVTSALVVGALALLLTSCEGSVARETSAAAEDSSLASMTVPGANATTVIEPRDTIAAMPAIPASTTPPISTATAAKTTRPAPKPASTPATTPAANTTPTTASTTAPPTTVVTPAATVTPTPSTTPSPVATPAPAPVPVTPPPTVSGRLTLQTGSRLWFDGSSTVKDFTCKAAKLEAAVVTSKADAASAIVAGEKSVAGVELTVPVMSIDCDNGTMNGHMRNALDAKMHPTITFELRSYDLMKAAENVAVTLSGTLTIHGESQPVTIQAIAVGAAEGALRLTGLYELNMKEYGVKPPSLMLGTMNVREKVKVRFDLLLRN